MIDAHMKARKYRLRDAPGDSVRPAVAHRFQCNVLDVEDFFLMPRPAHRAATVARKTLTLSDKSSQPQPDAGADSGMSPPAAHLLPIESRKVLSISRGDHDAPPGGADDPAPAPPHATPVISEWSRERPDVFYKVDGAFENCPPDVAAQFRSDAARIDDFFSWYRTLPPAFTDSMAPEYRRKLANVFGAQFARVKENRVELKAQDMAAPIAAAYRRAPIVVKIYSSRVRRWLVRNFHYTQKQVTLRSHTAEGMARNDAWIAEFEARFVWLSSTHPAETPNNLEHRGYYLAEVHITQHRFERVLAVMLQFDKILARLEVDQTISEMNSLLTIVTEPLGWLRNENAREPLTPYPIRALSPFIRQARRERERVPQRTEVVGASEA